MRIITSEQLQAEVDAGTVRTCRVSGCGRRKYAKGLCSPHYRRLRTAGEVAPEIPLRIAKYGDETTCKVKDCTRRPYARWLCVKHWTSENRKGC